MKITIVVYEGLTALDAVGPSEVLSRLPGARVRVVAPGGPPHVRTDNAAFALVVDGALEDEQTTDLLLVPGGPLTGALGEKPNVARALCRLHESSRITASVCTGSLILAAAGILEGKRATTHWASMDELAQRGAVPVAERFVVDGKIYSSAGVSAGIDMALRLAADLTEPRVAKSIQLGIEYDPAPPFNSGSPRTADPEIVDALRARFSQMAEHERS